MNTSRKFLIALTSGAVLIGGAAAVAQPPAPGAERPGFARGGPGGPGAMRGDPEARAERLREQLGISGAQDGAFDAWLEATQRGPDNRPDFADMADLTTPERLDRQLAEMQSRADATRRLYSVLSVEQKAIFDDLPPGVVMGGGRGDPGAMAGGRGPGRGEGRGRGQRLNNGVPGAYEPL